jgi:hypothetical protein
MDLPEAAPSLPIFDGKARVQFGQNPTGIGKSGEQLDKGRSIT